VAKKKGGSVGQTIGGIIVGFDQQIFRSTPPVNELVAKGTPLRAMAAAGGGTVTVGMPGDPPEDAAGGDGANLIRLTAPGVEAIVDLGLGARISSLRIDGRELIRTEGYGPIMWGSYPMVPYAGRVRDGRFTFEGREYRLPVTMPPHAIHGTVLDRAWQVNDDGSVAIDLGPDWPFAGRVTQRFALGADGMAFRLELEADEPMPASIGWHPWFRRRVEGVDGEVELDVEPGTMYLRDDAGITTEQRVTPPPPRPWDDCFTDLAGPPVLRWPEFLELTIDSECTDWVIYTVPEDAVCVEPQTAPPDSINRSPFVVAPGRPLVATMTWSWRRIAG
jgi:aldose 1-epimerase